ncbi:MAG: hypothetical protein U0H95_12605 [Lachnospira sp.]|nr:hypothetical protein [Lachnospira sp.]
MRTISRIARIQLKKLETAHYVDLAVRTPKTEQTLINLLKQVSTGKDADRYKNLIRRKIYELALNPQYISYNYGKEYYNVEQIRKEVKAYASEINTRFTFHFPIKKSRIKIIPENRKRTDRASRITILTLIGLGYLINDEKEALCSGIRTTQLARMIGCNPQSVQRALLWLEKNDIIYSPDTFDYSGIFSIYINDCQYAETGLFKKAAAGGKGYVAFSYETYQELCKMSCTELRIALIAHDIAASENTIAIKEYKELLPAYVTYKVLNDSLIKMNVENILNVSTNNMYFYITASSSGEKQSIQMYSNRCHDEIDMFMHKWMSVFGINMTDVAASDIQVYSPYTKNMISSVVHNSPTKQTILISTPELENLYKNCAEFDTKTIHNAFAYVIHLYENEHQQNMQDSLMYRIKKPEYRFVTCKTTINNIGAYIRKICELISRDVVTVAELSSALPATAVTLSNNENIA